MNRGVVRTAGNRFQMTPSATTGLVLFAVLISGCGARTPLSVGSDDAALDGSDADDPASQTGRCVFDRSTYPCAPGRVCMANYFVGASPVTCAPYHGGVAPCGLVFCGDQCACSDVERSTCLCE
jgi:hypothetical protein